MRKGDCVKKLQATRPIWHAVAWIVIYIILVGVGDAVSAVFGRENLATAFVLVGLSLGLLLYLRVNKWLGYYGIRSPRPVDYRHTLYYVPLLLMAVLQYTKGIDNRLDAVDVALIVVLMLCVGFLEELIFRGFLYRAILERSNLIRAIVISGVTFGIGHIVNLARGYTGAEQLLQIIIAVAIGIVLALLVALTGTIMPGVVFHVLINISGSLTATNLEGEILVSAAILVICVVYSGYLIRQLRQKQFGGAPATTTSTSSTPRR